MAVRIATGVHRPERGRAQRRGGVCAGEEDPVGGHCIEPGAAHTLVAVSAEKSAKVVALHDQHIVA
jgi:hypothetical protein